MKLEKRFIKTALNNLMNYNKHFNRIIHIYKNSKNKELIQLGHIKEATFNNLWLKLALAISQDNKVIWLNDVETDILNEAINYVGDCLIIEQSIIKTIKGGM